MQLRPVSERIVLEVTPDVRVLAFGLALAAATGLLFGLFPALRSSRLGLVTGLKNGAPPGGRSTRSRSFFVGAQLAMSVLLLVIAGCSYARCSGGLP